MPKMSIKKKGKIMDNTDKRILQLHKMGFTQEQIGAVVGIGRTGISRRLKKILYKDKKIV